MGQLVPAKRTILTDDALLHAFDEAWGPEMGGVPSHQTIAVLAAQVRLETGMTYCWNWNVGNYKKYGTWDWQRLKTTEVVDGHSIDIVDDFAVFPDLATGVQMFIRAQSTSRWKDAWDAAMKGDPVAYAQGLGEPPLPYYTGSVKNYTAGVTRYFAYYLAILGGASQPRPPDISDLKVAFLMPDLDPIDPYADTQPPTPRNV